MPRPRQNRKLKNLPVFKGFKPIGIPAAQTEVIELLFDEYEVVRLLDYENLSQEAAAKQINVSRPTLTRIYQSARQKIAMALAEGLTIRFVESPHVFVVKDYFCRSCQHSFEVTNENTSLTCPHCGSKDIVEIKPGNSTAKSYRAQRRQHLYFGQKSFHGPQGFCICPNCGKREKHIPGIPCREQKCPDCGTFMIKEISTQNNPDKSQ